MTSKAVAKSLGGVLPVTQKYTVGSTGVWERIRRALAVSPERSSGVPLNAQFRNPPPGANDPLRYDDPVSVPAADLADNPYWRRDVRRAHARLSVVGQAEVVALLSVGSKAAPREDRLGAGEEGQKNLVAVRGEGEKGLAAYLEREEGAAAQVLGEGGMPPMPVGMAAASGNAVKRYVLEEEQSYGGNYPCRTFS